MSHKGTNGLFSPQNMFVFNTQLNSEQKKEISVVFIIGNIN